MNSIIAESQYFGTISYIITLFQKTNIIIEQWDKYPKASFRNRCLVTGANGPIVLSIPLEGGRNVKGLMKDVRISYAGRWQQEHIRTLESCYARSPYYEYYRDAVRRLWEKKQVFLLDKNMAILEWLANVFAYNGRITLTASYHESSALIAEMDMRNKVLPRNYLSWQTPQYRQVFEDRMGFQRNMSILDLLCCNGPSLKIGR